MLTTSHLKTFPSPTKPNFLEVKHGGPQFLSFFLWGWRIWWRVYPFILLFNIPILFCHWNFIRGGAYPPIFVFIITSKMNFSFFFLGWILVTFDIKELYRQVSSYHKLPVLWPPELNNGWAPSKKRISVFIIIVCAISNCSDISRNWG